MTSSGTWDLRIIISPAKRMRAASEPGPQGDFPVRGVPPFPQKTTRLLEALRRLGPAGARDVWQCGERLAEESWRRTQELVIPLAWDEARPPDGAALLAPALFSYVGIQYQSMAPGVLDDAALEWLGRHLFILSGMYGCVRPFDGVMPYRLEMGARLAVGAARDLYEYWGPDIARAVIRDAGDGARGGDRRVCVVNLASVEYAKAVLPYVGPSAPSGASPDSRPAVRVVTCVFGEELRGVAPRSVRQPAKWRGGAWCAGWRRTKSMIRPTSSASMLAIALRGRFRPMTCSCSCAHKGWQFRACGSGWRETRCRCARARKFACDGTNITVGWTSVPRSMH